MNYDKIISCLDCIDICVYMYTCIYIYLALHHMQNASHVSKI